MKISEGLVDSFRALILSKLGIQIDNVKSIDLRRSLIASMKNFNIIDPVFFFELLQKSPCFSDAFQEVIKEITVGETFFFRHFEDIHKQLIPELLNEKKQEKQLCIWCAGCSTGEEAYSTAISILENLADPESWQIFILATDISKERITFAKNGIYTEWALRQMPKYLIRKYFIQISEKQFQIRDDLKQLVTFKEHNLIEESFHSIKIATREFDLIFCRNVTIYFGQNETKKVAKWFYKCLRTHGYLVVGHSEPSQEIYGLFHYILYDNVVVYQKLPVASPVKFEEIQPLSPKNDNRYTDELFSEALEHYKHRRMQKALFKLKRLLTLDENHIQSLLLKAFICADERDYMDAKIYCDRVLEIDSVNVNAYYLKALLFKEEMYLDEAIMLICKAIEIDSDFLLGYYELIQMYSYNHRLDLVEPVFRKFKLVVQKFNNEDDVGIFDNLSVYELKLMIKQIYTD